MNIKGSTVLVTGANRGLGRAFVQALLAAGAKKIYAAARDPKSIEITVWGPKQDADLMKRYEDLGVSRVVFNLESEKADTILPVIDGWAKLMRQVNG